MSTVTRCRWCGVLIEKRGGVLVPTRWQHRPEGWVEGYNWCAPAGAGSDPDAWHLAEPKPA